MYERTKYSPCDFEVSGKDLLPITTKLLVEGCPFLGALRLGKRPVLEHRTGGLPGYQKAMTEHNSPADKSIVEELETIVDIRDVLIPAECGCKAGNYEDYCGYQQVVETARAGVCAVLHVAAVDRKNSSPFRVSGLACYARFEVDL
ncbi:hypothetical protein [Halorubrum kocurii]|uniref:hypothetical protein n=1 Tax=Halorubrum kocurii TaxID=478441 RepID=UPI001268C879|nr:hypothetical protein [Halorubrum kocurii]